MKKTLSYYDKAAITGFFLSLLFLSALWPFDDFNLNRDLGLTYVNGKVSDISYDDRVIFIDKADIEHRRSTVYISLTEFDNRFYFDLNYTNPKKFDLPSHSRKYRTAYNNLINIKRGEDVTFGYYPSYQFSEYSDERIITVQLADGTYLYSEQDYKREHLPFVSGLVIVTFVLLAGSVWRFIFLLKQKMQK